MRFSDYYEEWTFWWQRASNNLLLLRHLSSENLSKNQILNNVFVIPVYRNTTAGQTLEMKKLQRFSSCYLEPDDIDGSLSGRGQRLLDRLVPVAVNEFSLILQKWYLKTSLYTFLSTDFEIGPKKMCWKILMENLIYYWFGLEEIVLLIFYFCRGKTRSDELSCGFSATLEKVA